jgi:hypothetical protein
MPHNLESEQATLGAILLRSAVMQEVSGLLGAEDFYDPGHRVTFRAMEELHEAGEPIDLVTVTSRLGEQGKLEMAGGAAFLAQLSEHVGTSANVAYYARQVREAATRRQIIDLGHDLVREGSKAGTPIKDLAQFLESRTQDLASRNGANKGLDLGAAILGVNEFKKVDLPERASLLHPFLREYSIGMITADRGTGKTMLALSLCNAISRGVGFGPWQGGEPTNCLYIDGEMVAHDIIERLNYLAPGDRPAQLNIYSDHYATLQGLSRANLLDPAWCTGIKEFCLANGVRLVVFDNLASLAAGVDENSAQEWSPLAKYFLDLRFAGISSLLLHHTGKSGLQRGTHAREDALDYSIVLERPKDYEPDMGTSFTLKFTKSRVRQSDAHLVAPVNLKLERNPHGDYTWTWKAAKKASQEAVLEMLNQGFKQQDIADAVGISRSMVAKIKAQAIKDGKLIG